MPNQTGWLSEISIMMSSSAASCKVAKGGALEGRVGHVQAGGPAHHHESILGGQ